jgi:hypothetical protein
MGKKEGKKDKLEAARRACYADIENTGDNIEQIERSHSKEDFGELNVDIYCALVDYAHDASIPLCEYLSYENVNRFIELIV